MSIKNFDNFLNEDIETNGDTKVEIKVKDIIEFLQSIDPEIPVYLDKNGWDYYYKNPQEIIKNSGLFHVWDSRLKGGKSMTINN